ncbi:hypothetical protein [Candidatus Soleaferrea massiliensis]|uniref:hypothetical protein n=1 Tax=Candidatus Soleaferrea massiliensis TaxID=1470354 RepID=UPI00058B389E|nr:hypothetical protein [Candidatus Soleaferrea massiliensis]
MSNQEIAWKQFIETGRIEAYLRYRGIQDILQNQYPQQYGHVQQYSARTGDPVVRGDGEPTFGGVPGVPEQRNSIQG